MRLLSFMDGTRPAVGWLGPDNQVIRLDDLLPEFSSLDMIGVLAAGIPLRQRVAGALAQVRQNMPSRRLGDVTLLPPVQRPSKIIGAARNYFDAIEELNIEVPVRPQLFAKLPNTVIAHGAPIPLWAASNAVTYEGELAVIIGTRGRDIPAAQAMDFVGGYTVLNDVSATDVTRQDGFYFGKNLAGFCPFGPVLVTPDDIPDPHNLRIATSVDGRIVQNSSTSQMVFGIPALIEAISRIMTLEIGDIIATGTPAGVAATQKPPLFLQDGMTVTVTIERVGTLSNPVSGPAS
jgi:2-keto-4-pentenoate hydratase/2-oxohepta-3-ene-1,7-dioic acid hydratase in catechol pathway